MSLKVVGNAVSTEGGEQTETSTAAAPAQPKKKDKSAKEKVELKKKEAKEKAESTESEIQISDGQVINLKFKKDAYFGEVMRKLAQKSDLLRQIDGWKEKTKKARSLVKDIDADLEAIEDHYDTHKAKIK